MTTRASVLWSAGVFPAGSLCTPLSGEQRGRPPRASSHFPGRLGGSLDSAPLRAFSHPACSGPDPTKRHRGPPSGVSEGPLNNSSISIPPLSMHTCVHGVLVHIHLSADVLHRLVCQCLHTSWHMTHSHMFQCTYVCLCIVGTHKLVSAHNPPFLSKHHTTVESLLPHTCTALPTQSRELDVAASSTLRTPNVPRTPNYAWFRSGTTKHSCIAGSQQYIFPTPKQKGHQGTPTLAELPASNFSSPSTALQA